jgi:hypothetical protein
MTPCKDGATIASNVAGLEPWNEWVIGVFPLSSVDPHLASPPEVIEVVQAHLIAMMSDLDRPFFHGGAGGRRRC